MITKSQKITNFIISPLFLAAVLYFGYRILDVVLYRYVQGFMTIRYSDGSMETMDFINCRMTENVFKDKQLAVSDDRGRGMVFELTNQGTAIPVLMNTGNKEMQLGGGKCRVPGSDLILANFSLRHNFRIVQSWKGSAVGECDTESGKVQFSVKVHACR